MELDETNLLDLGQEPATEPAETPEPDDEMEEVQSDDGFEAEADDPDDDAEEGDDPDAVAAPEMTEIDFNGKKYQVPAELKDGFLMQADYTRKTQGLAEEKRQIEARAQEIDAMRNVAQEEMNARATLIGINQRLQQYQNVDWNAWQDDDPIAAQKGYIEYQQLERQAGQIGQYLQNAENQRTAQSQQDTAKRLRETREFAEKQIPGWSPEVDAKVTEFAERELGFSREILMGAYSPPVYKALHLAWIGSQAIKNGAGKRPAPTPIKPLQTVSSKTSGTTTKDPANMSMDEYAKWAAKRFKG